ncbi:tyrosine-type recombinase/integrase [Beduini sp.]|uniref:tyrosine-type recombinase/integrase n=1 Tax=Beduini sp. TaxID=1922300 RepID=UPI00399070A3
MILFNNYNFRNQHNNKIIKTDFLLSYNGTPTNKHSLPRAIEKLSEMTKMYRIKVHTLRHSHVSLLIRMGKNPLIIKERLSHEYIETTLGTYGHLYPNSNFEVARKLKNVINYQPANTDKNNNSLIKKTILGR